MNLDVGQSEDATESTKIAYSLAWYVEILAKPEEISCVLRFVDNDPRFVRNRSLQRIRCNRQSYRRSRPFVVCSTCYSYTYTNGFLIFSFINLFQYLHTQAAGSHKHSTACVPGTRTERFLPLSYGSCVLPPFGK